MTKFNNKRTIAVYCYRFFDIRNLVSAGVISALSKRCRVVLVVKPDLIPILREHFGPDIIIESIGDAEAKFGCLASIKSRFNTLCASILLFTYAERGFKVNRTGRLHRRSYLERARHGGLANWFYARVVVYASIAACRLRFIRRFLQWIYAQTVLIERYSDVMKRYRPDLNITCSFGLEDDGGVIIASRNAEIPTCAVLQSWDKTSSKGYPSAHPTHALVWNEITKGEAIGFLEMPSDRVSVAGAPLWDKHFSTNLVIPRSKFFSKFGLSLSKKVIFVGLAPQAFHKANIDLMIKLVEAHRSNAFGVPVQLLFRFHPGYLTSPTLLKELNFWAHSLGKEPGVTFSQPAAMHQNNGYSLIEEDDFSILASCFSHCSVVVSVASSHFIESAFYDKPCVSVEYGRWKTEWYDFDIGNYDAEHIHRVLSVGSILRSRDSHQLIDNITQSLKEPHRFSKERSVLVEQEATTHRGDAVEATVNLLLSILD